MFCESERLSERGTAAGGSVFLFGIAIRIDSCANWLLLARWLPVEWAAIVLFVSSVFIPVKAPLSNEPAATISLY
jgi:hypothetical protein